VTILKSWKCGECGDRGRRGYKTMVAAMDRAWVHANKICPERRKNMRLEHPHADCSNHMVCDFRPRRKTSKEDPK
jgi:hypothetical protein